MVFWKLAWREIRQHPGRSVVTLLGTAIGVTAVVAVTIATEVTDRAFEAMFQSVTGRAALEISAAGDGSLEESLVERVAGVPGVQTAAPLIQRPTILYFENRRTKLLSLGIDPVRDKEVHPLTITAGESLEESKGVLINATLAQSLGIRPGDTVKLLMRRGLIGARVAGLYQFQGTTAVVGGASLLMTIPAAQYGSKMPGEISSVQVVLEPDAAAETVQAAIAARLPSGVHVRAPAVRSSFAEETALSTQRGMDTARAFLLLVAVLVITNTFSINVTQRRRQLGIMRAIGATQRQIAVMLYCEALLLGLLGAAFGWLAGTIGAHYLTRAMGSLYETSLPPIELTWTALGLAVGFGICISLLGVWLPARRAGRLSPVEAMREVVSPETEDTSRWQIALGFGLVVCFSVTLAGSIQGWLPTRTAVWSGVLILSGLVLLMQTVVRPLSWLVWIALRPALRVESRLARLQLLRHRSRTILTIAVMFIAISTGVGLASSISDNVSDVKNWYRRTIVADFFLRAMSPDMATGQAADLPDEVGAEIREIPHLSSIRSTRFISARAADQNVIVVAFDSGGSEELVFDLGADSPADVPQRLKQGQVVIGSVLAQRAGGLGPGDQISLETDAGETQLRIAAVANDYLAGGKTIYLRIDAAKKLLDVAGVDAYLINADHEHLTEVRQALAEIADRHGLLLQSYSDVQEEIDQKMAGVVAGLWGLVVLGFAVAALSVANTLTMNVLDQTREIGLLRVVGTTQWQVRKTILAQAIMIGVLALVPGMLAGLIVAYLMHLSTYPVTGHPVHFAFRPLLIFGGLVVGMLLTIVAAWFPAQRAARLPLLDTLRTQ